MNELILEIVSCIVALAFIVFAVIYSLHIAKLHYPEKEKEEFDD
jgi:uncharacterized protein YoxC